MIKLNVEGYSSSYLDELQQLISALTTHKGVINTKVIQKEEIRGLNKTYAGKDEPTDVLSFSYLEQRQASSVKGKGYSDKSSSYSYPQPSTLNPQPSELGDIVISSEHIKKQANLAGTSEETEFILLLLHGVLHVLGFDHATEGQRTEMDRLQSEFMQKLGLVYRDFGWYS